MSYKDWQLVQLSPGKLVARCLSFFMFFGMLRAFTWLKIK